MWWSLGRLPTVITGLCCEKGEPERERRRRREGSVGSDRAWAREWGERALLGGRGDVARRGANARRATVSSAGSGADLQEYQRVWYGRGAPGGGQGLLR